MRANDPAAKQRREPVLNTDFTQWRHLFKLDPEKPISDGALERLCASGTDAIVVGGSTGVTFGNTDSLLRRIRRYDVPCALEVSDREAIVPGFDLYFIPVVLNASDVNWIVGQHHRAIREYGDVIPWDSIVTEGYVILNGSSAAARLTGANAGVDAEDVAAYARMADKLFRFSIFYVEYSGAFGDMELVRKARRSLERARLFYGGGIDGFEKAKRALAAADAIVVGNVIYEHLERALETVRALEH